MVKYGSTRDSEVINKMLLLPHFTNVPDGSGGDSSILQTRILRTKEVKQLAQEHSSRAGHKGSLCFL